MLRTANRSAPPTARTPVRIDGMRRVSWVRISVADGRTRCEVVGVGHRLPTVRQVSLKTAMALAASGVPSVVRAG